MIPEPADPATHEIRPASREHERLAGLHGDIAAWRRWGPYVSERSWGTVREDYSADGCAWDFLPHDLARSTAYRWGEDGLAGICDRYQILVFRPCALERTRSHPEGALLRSRADRGQPRRGRQGILLLPRFDPDAFVHAAGSTSTRSAAYPYLQLIEENQRREGRGGSTSFSTPASSTTTAISTSTVEYAKASTRGSGHPDRRSRTAVPMPAPIHLLPHLWFRNTWAWSEPPGPGAGHRSRDPLATDSSVCCRRPDGDTPAQPALRVPAGAALPLRRSGWRPPLHRQRDERRPGLSAAARAAARPYVKDAFHRQVIDGEDGDQPGPARARRRACTTATSFRRTAPSRCYSG